MVDGVGLIHMKGRVYDPALGRFLSADPYITEIDNTQNHNRYNYVYNNPLTLTDPNGFDATNKGPIYDGPIRWPAPVPAKLKVTVNVSINISSPNRNIYLPTANKSVITSCKAVCNNMPPVTAKPVAAPVPAKLKFGVVAFDMGELFGQILNDLSNNRNARGIGGSSSAGALNTEQEEFERKYGDILKAGKIDILQDMKDAANMQFGDFIKKVETDGDWDYKNSEVLKDAGINKKLLDEFGNFHFGMVANAFGFGLEAAMYGAGAYQVKQGGGSKTDFITATNLMTRTAGGLMLWDGGARAVTRGGFTWGDNPGDSINIMNGWDYAQNNF